jgi:hypothetical protein
VENRETTIRIDPYILAREIREMTRKREGKDETLERRNWRNEDPDRPSDLSPRFAPSVLFVAVRNQRLDPDLNLKT